MWDPLGIRKNEESTHRECASTWSQWETRWPPFRVGRLARHATPFVPGGHILPRTSASDDVQRSAPHLTAPQGLIDWLTYNTGAIYVED